MAKIITSSTPSWFWNSKSFTEGKRLPDISTLPDIVMPINKVCTSMLRQEEHLSQIVDGKHPLERIGFNYFFDNLAGLTNYPNSKLAYFTDFGYDDCFHANPSCGDPSRVATNEQYWTFNARPHRIQYINGETTIGYDGWAIMGNPSKANKLRSIITNGIAEQANQGNIIRVGTYSWNAIGHKDYGITNHWYGTDTNTGFRDDLINLQKTQANIYSPQLDAGCNGMFQQIYALNDTYYDYPAFFAYMCVINRVKHPNGEYPIYSLLWTDNETVDGFPLTLSKYRRLDGQLINLKYNIKPNAPAEYIYTAALISLTIGDGCVGWEGIMPQIDSDRPDKENTGYDTLAGQESVEFGTPPYMNGQYYVRAMARCWNSNIMYWHLAMQHIAPYKDIIEGQTYWWTSPNFNYKGNYRSGDYKMIPYCKYNKDPIVLIKFNNAGNKGVIVVYNPWEVNNLSVVPVTVYVNHVNDDGVTEFVVNVNGTKAEIYGFEL